MFTNKFLAASWPKLWLAAAAALLVAMSGPGRLHAQASASSQDSGSQWEQLTLSGDVIQLFTPASGAFFALTSAHQLFRSDDAGAHWRLVRLPPPGTGFHGRHEIEVDPTDHQVVYAAGADGLYQTTDDAASWHVVMPFGQDMGWNIDEILVSPADHNLLFARLWTHPGGNPNDSELGSTVWRSGDRGRTWQAIQVRSAGPITPHPTDPSRLFAALGKAFLTSNNQGDSFSLLQLVDGERGASGGPEHALVGGRGALPGRWYTAVWDDQYAAPRFEPPFAGSDLYRSDDDSGTWTDVLAFHDGSPGTLMSGLASDPSNPDHVWAMLTTRTPDPQDAQHLLKSSRLQASGDDGLTWSDMGQAIDGSVSDLVLGVDGANLYAATDSGVWRLPLNGD